MLTASLILSLPQSAQANSSWTNALAYGFGYGVGNAVAYQSIPYSGCGVTICTTYYPSYYPSYTQPVSYTPYYSNYNNYHSPVMSGYDYGSNYRYNYLASNYGYTSPYSYGYAGYRQPAYMTCTICAYSAYYSNPIYMGVWYPNTGTSSTVTTNYNGPYRSPVTYYQTANYNSPTITSPGYGTESIFSAPIAPTAQINTGYGSEGTFGTRYSQPSVGGYGAQGTFGIGGYGTESAFTAGGYGAASTFSNPVAGYGSQETFGSTRGYGTESIFYDKPTYGTEGSFK